MNALDIGTLALAAVAATLAGLRWLRVAQREHYLAGSATRFALRWWLGFGPNRVLGAAGVLGVVLSPISSLAALFGVGAVAAGPFRMSLLGRAPGPLAWTQRLRRVAVLVGLLTVAPVALASLAGAAVPVAAAAVLLSPLLVDVACAAIAPWEDRLANRFVDEAAAKLRQVAPTVVAITGSYGKTSTKVYLTHLCASSLRVLPSPASYNNRAGLSRAINENLTPGTEVFVAEMGTYGRGEIAALCAWCPPRIAAITAIGPVHLERFGSEEEIVRAKREIFGPAEVAVLNVDDLRLAAVADELAAGGRRVVRCSTTDAAADVCVRREGSSLQVTVGGQPLAPVAVAAGAQPTNVAVAVALALELGVGLDTMGEALATLPAVANRQALVPLGTGAVAIDDTFNSNPAGCQAALAALCEAASPEGKRVVVTPGMVELGPRQKDENAAFGRAIAADATHLIVVGWTNRRALLAGAAEAGPRPLQVLLVDTREQAVAWVRQHTGPGDAVLYENDVPDHYP